MVIISHSFALSLGASSQHYIDSHHLNLININTWGFLAVAVFFFGSGFYIAKSCERNESFLVFLLKRLFKLLPMLILVVLISIFIIGNTIKLTVHARRKEISIMKYVGATDSFIRWPFVIEGIIIGIVAALLSILVLGIAYSLITNAAANSIISTMGIKLLSFTDMTTLLVIVYMVLGIGIGALGSSISMRKYLQV